MLQVKAKHQPKRKMSNFETNVSPTRAKLQIASKLFQQNSEEKDLKNRDRYGKQKDRKQSMLPNLVSEDATDITLKETKNQLQLLSHGYINELLTNKSHLSMRRTSGFNSAYRSNQNLTQLSQPQTTRNSTFKQNAGISSLNTSRESLPKIITSISKTEHKRPRLRVDNLSTFNQTHTMMIKDYSVEEDKLDEPKELSHVHDANCKFFCPDKVFIGGDLDPVKTRIKERQISAQLQQNLESETDNFKRRVSMKGKVDISLVTQLQNHLSSVSQTALSIAKQRGNFQKIDQRLIHKKDLTVQQSKIQKALHKLNLIQGKQNIQETISNTGITELQCLAEVPKLLKIEINGRETPCQVSIQYKEKSNKNLTVYASLVDKIPDQNHYQVKHKSPSIFPVYTPGYIKSDKRTHQYEFSHLFLYLTLESKFGCNISIETTFGQLQTEEEKKFDQFIIEFKEKQKQEKIDEEERLLQKEIMQKLARKFANKRSSPTLASINSEESDRQLNNEPETLENYNIMQAVNWNEIKQENSLIGKLNKQVRMKVAQTRVKQLEDQKRIQAQNGLTKWQEFRVKRDKAITKYIKAKSKVISCGKFVSQIIAKHSIKRIYRKFSKLKKQIDFDTMAAYKMTHFVIRMRMRYHVVYPGSKNVTDRDLMRIRALLTFKGIAFSDLESYKAVRSVILPFFTECKWRKELHWTIEEFAKQIKFIQHRMKYQLIINNVRREVLFEMWEAEKKVLKYDLGKSKAKDSQTQLKGFENFNNQLAIHLLEAFIERCKFKHAFAFFQFRKQLPNPKYHDIQTIFGERKQHLLDHLEQVRSLVVDNHVLTKDKGKKNQTKINFLKDAEERGKQIQPQFQIKVNNDDANSQIARLDIDQTNRIDSLETIGMTNPFEKAKSIHKAIQTVTYFNSDYQVYPESIMQSIIGALQSGDICQPPKCIFLPEKALIRVMIKAVLKYSKESPDVFMLRFGIVLNQAKANQK